MTRRLRLRKSRIRARISRPKTSASRSASADAACRTVLDHAVTCLVLVRGGAPHDPGAHISTLVSLIADAHARLPDAVADARHQGYTWNRIAERLGSTVSAARHRFAGYTRCCRQLRLFD